MAIPFNRAFRILASLLLPTLAIAGPAQATWYGENIETGSDIMMMDVRWPWWPESTYYANWNFTTNPSGIGGYGGFAGQVDTLEPDHRPNLDETTQAACRPGSVWSFWGAGKNGEPPQVVASSQYTYPHRFVGEGATAALSGPVWPFMQTKRWYTMVMRVWEPVGVENPQYSYVGRWIKDVENDRWYLYGVVRLPVPGTSFKGNSGFVEDFGNRGRSARSMHRRLGYFRKDGQWLKSNTATYKVPPKKGQGDTYWVVNVVPEGDHEVLAMELSANPAMLPVKLQGQPLELGKTHAFTVKQPEAPSLDQPIVTDVKAESNGKQVVVSWNIPASSSPPFAYKVEVFDNPGCQGQPKVVRQERMPWARTVLVDAAISKPTVRLTVSDVFDQPAAPVVLAAHAAADPVSSIAAKTEPGVEYELLFRDAARHENFFYPEENETTKSRKEEHYWLSIAELESGRRVQSGVALGFDTNLRGDRKHGYGFKFKGLLLVPADGLYVLRVQGSDGYRIVVDGHEAIAWDGPHGPTEKTTVLNLAKGYHPLAADYFVDTSSAPYFKLEWEGPGLPKEEIPLAALSHAAAGQTPELTLASAVGAGGGAITVDVDSKNHKIVKTSLFVGDLRIAESHGAKLAYTGPMPEGENTVWARLVYDRDHTIDSQRQTVTISGSTVKDWNLGVAGAADSRHGLWQTGPDSFSFIGEGEYVVSRRIQGDFTLTCRIDSYAGARDEGVNAHCWVGLTAREDASKNNHKWGRQFGLMQTAGSGLRTTPNYSDLASTRVSDYALAKDRPWLRIVRQGAQWTAWTSADGIDWEQGAMHVLPSKNEMDAGLVFRTMSKDALAYFHAQVSHLKLEPGAAKDVVPPVLATAKNTDGARLTGVAMAPSDPNVVVVRSTNLGLLRSIDGGLRWSQANGGLSGADNCIRSAAIHPQNPRIMLRAAGRAGENGELEGGLARTRDGGDTWQKLGFPGDFDGDGPSALCGEVVAFDPANPEILFAGCETKGFFRSGDGGETWMRIGAVGERITAVTVNRWIREKDDQAYLHVVTCPDVWMSVLGRGEPKSAARVTATRDYASHNGGASLQRMCERTDLGYLNVAFDKGASHAPTYATTHGVLNSLNDGRQTYLLPPPKNLECFRPVTALACAAIGEGRRGRCLAQPLDPMNPGRLSRSDFVALSWNWQTLSGDRPAGGLISACGELRQGQEWWLLAIDGLYHSTDGGATLKKVLDEKGTALN